MNIFWLSSRAGSILTRIEESAILTYFFGIEIEIKSFFKQFSESKSSVKESISEKLVESYKIEIEFENRD